MSQAFVLDRWISIGQVKLLFEIKPDWWRRRVMMKSVFWWIMMSWMKSRLFLSLLSMWFWILLQLVRRIKLRDNASILITRRVLRMSVVLCVMFFHDTETWFPPFLWMCFFHIHFSHNRSQKVLKTRWVDFIFSAVQREVFREQFPLGLPILKKQVTLKGSFWYAFLAFSENSNNTKKAKALYTFISPILCWHRGQKYY